MVGTRRLALLTSTVSKLAVNGRMMRMKGLQVGALGKNRYSGRYLLPNCYQILEPDNQWANELTGGGSALINLEGTRAPWPENSKYALGRGLEFPAAQSDDLELKSSLKDY